MDVPLVVFGYNFILPTLILQVEGVSGYDEVQAEGVSVHDEV